MALTVCARFICRDQYDAIPNARIAWLDLDYSSWVLAHLLGDQADYRDLGAEDIPALCPLALLDQADGLTLLFDWFSRLFARWEIVLNQTQAADLTRALELARLHKHRSLVLLMSMLQDQRLRSTLQHYAEGQWAHVFGGDCPPPDARVAIYELRNLINLGKQAYAPAMELVLHSIVAKLTGDPVWCLVDEFWQFLADEVSSGWLLDTIRTFRKRNGGFIGCTQSLLDIAANANSQLRELLLIACPGKIFLPNDDARGEYVREAYYKFGLNSHEIDLISNAQPQRQYYYHSRLGSRLFNLELGPIAQAVCAATNLPDVAAARRVFEESDCSTFLDNWLAERGATV